MRESIKVRGARGVAYVPLPADLEARLADWIQQGTVTDGEEIRKERLYRTRTYGTQGLAVKFFGPRTRLRFRDRLRISPAIRFADLARSIEAVGTPTPIVALDLHEGGRRVRSLVAYEWVEGQTLEKLWGENEVAVQAFPGFLAAMHGARTFHGDFHLHQALWDGTRWVLIDLDGVRHPFRSLPARRLATEHWAQVLLGLGFWRDLPPEEARGIFQAYAAGAGILTAADWPTVVERTAVLRSVRGLPAPGESVR